MKMVTILLPSSLSRPTWPPGILSSMCSTARKHSQLKIKSFFSSQVISQLRIWPCTVSRGSQMYLFINFIKIIELSFAISHLGIKWILSVLFPGKNYCYFFFSFEHQKRVRGELWCYQNLVSLEVNKARVYNRHGSHNLCT